MSTHLEPSVSKLPLRIGFIGLGNMGWHMCMNLCRKLPLTAAIYIHDVASEVLVNFIQRAEQLGYNNVVGCTNAREVASQADMVFSIVPEGSHVRDVYLHPTTGILAAPRHSLPRFLIDCSTIDTATSLELAKKVHFISAHDEQPSNHVNNGEIFFYDAPVSGGTPGAEKATLTFMLGTYPSDPNAETLTHILGMMGTNIFFCGGPSLGLVTKLCNNYLSGLIAIATSEAMNMGMRHGVEPAVLQQCFSKSSGANWVNDTVNPVPGVCPDAVTSRDYEGGFKIQLMKKDFGLAVQSAREVGAKLVLGDAGLEAYTKASEDLRCRDRDSRVIYRWLGGKE